MKPYGGIELHSNNSVLVLIDEEDRVVVEKRLRNDLALMLAELARATFYVMRDRVEFNEARAFA